MCYSTKEELLNIGFKFVGDGVKLSKKVSIYNAKNISIDDNTRIDDFCILSAGEGGIEIGKHVHIAVYTSLIGKGKIILSDYSNISSRVSIYSSNDDYSGEFMTNPTINEEFTNVSTGPVYIGKHVIIGSGSVILPNVCLDEGVSIGALSLVNKNCKAFKIYGGVPIKKIKNRSRKLINLEKEFINGINRKKD